MACVADATDAVVASSALFQLCGIFDRCTKKLSEKFGKALEEAYSEVTDQEEDWDDLQGSKKTLMDRIIKLWSTHLLPSAYCQEYKLGSLKGHANTDMQHAFFRQMKEELNKYITENGEAANMGGWIDQRLKQGGQDVTGTIMKVLTSRHQKVRPYSIATTRGAPGLSSYTRRPAPSGVRAVSWRPRHIDPEQQGHAAVKYVRTMLCTCDNRLLSVRCPPLPPPAAAADRGRVGRQDVLWLQEENQQEEDSGSSNSP